MAAAAFKGTVSLRGISGESYIEAISMSDVANAYVTFDATGLTFCHIPEPAAIVDIVCVTGGTDTTKMRIFVNGRDTGKTFVNTAVLNTINNRVPLPINVGKPSSGQGVDLQIKQLA